MEFIDHVYLTGVVFLLEYILVIDIIFSDLLFCF